MEARSLEFIAKACIGELVGGSPQTQVLRVRTDSRKVEAGDLFFALSGGRFDGHDFLHQAAGKGACGVVANRNRLPEGWGGTAIIAVDDTRKALGRLGAQYRKDFVLPTVAVGGSNGKTTTKELIAAVLRQKLATLWSEASYNNDIGVPLTLLRLQQSHQVAVFEVGTNHPGELAALAKMIRPDYGILTCVGREHLEFFGDLAGVAREQGSLAEELRTDGILLVNGDDKWAIRVAERSCARIVRVGLSPDNDWRARGIRVDLQGVTFQLEGPRREDSGECRIHLLGRHQVVNALFAVAIGVELGLNRAEITEGLAACRPPKMRLELCEYNGVRVLDDAYNANADSTTVALQTLQALPCKGRRVAVLGDMAELGAHSQAAHEEVGRQAAELGVGQLFAVGTMAPIIARAARDSGLVRVFEFADVETAATAVKRFVREGDVVLLKASRITRLERIGEALRCRKAGSTS